MPKPKILVVEDERSFVEVLSCNLEREGFEVLAAHDGQEGLRQAQLKLPDLVVLDLMLPLKPGLEVCRELKRGSHAGDPDHHGHGEGGGVRRTGRVRDRCRRLCHEAVQHEDPDSAHQEGTAPTAVEGGAGRRQVVESQGIVIDRHSHRALYRDQELPLTPTEFRLLEVLLRQAGRAFTRFESMDAAIGEDAVVSGTDDRRPYQEPEEKARRAGELIETVRGVGYRFHEPRMVNA